MYVIVIFKACFIQHVVFTVRATNALLPIQLAMHLLLRVAFKARNI